MIQRAVRFSVSLARSIIAVGVEWRRRSVFFVTVIDCFPNLAFFEASRLEQTDFLRDSREEHQMAAARRSVELRSLFQLNAIGAQCAKFAS